MKKLALAALLAAAPTLALAQSWGTGHTDCDYIVNDPERPDCIGYNPFYPGADRYAARARQLPPSYFDPYGMAPARPGSLRGSR